jgi:hypothetical protein
VNVNPPFDLWLFSTDPRIIREAVAAGVEGIVVDLERRGKRERQISADTQVGLDTFDDLERVRACTPARVVCRINGDGGASPDDVDRAIAGGADEILLPMVRNAAEVEAVLHQIKGRCRLGILVETMSACQHVNDLACLPLSRVYVGLNDLSIERGTPSIFTAVADGTLQHVRSAFSVPFGFGGLTLPDRGQPIPCRLLIGEMMRIGSRFSFLRRSFYRDVRGHDLGDSVSRILHAVERAAHRPTTEAERDRLDLERAIQTLDQTVVTARALGRA